MWGSFKAAFAATVGALLAYGLVQKLSTIDMDDVKGAVDEVKEKMDKASSDWKNSRKISEPGDGFRDHHADH